MTLDEQKEARTVCLESRKFEIELLWKRAEFFSIFVGVALVAYSTFRKDDPAAALVIVCFGLAASVVWMLANSGSKWWQEHWEIKTKKEFDFAPYLFDSTTAVPKKNWLLPIRRFSVSKLLILLSAYSSLLWFGLFFRELNRLIPISARFPCLWDQRYPVVMILTGAFIALVLWKGRGEES